DLRPLARRLRGRLAAVPPRADRQRRGAGDAGRASGDREPPPLAAAGTGGPRTAAAEPALRGTGPRRRGRRRQPAPAGPQAGPAARGVAGGAARPGPPRRPEILVSPPRTSRRPVPGAAGVGAAGDGRRDARLRLGRPRHPAGAEGWAVGGAADGGGQGPRRLP